MLELKGVYLRIIHEENSLLFKILAFLDFSIFASLVSVPLF